MAFKLNPQFVRDTLSKATQELPPLPNVLMRVLQLTETANNGTVNEIERLIKSDQAISSKLLRVVNSPYFGLGGQVSSVNQAIVVLGYQQVRNLVLSVSMMSSFSAIGNKAKDAQMRFWELSFGTASAAQALARRKGLESKDSEMVFVGGLLQSIGGLFMLSALSQTYLSVVEEAENSGARLYDVENLRLGTNHAEVGGQLLKKWRLPENLQILVSRHEGPFEGDPIAALYAVHVGERTAELLIRHQPVTLEALALEPSVQEWLAMSEGDLTKFASDISAKVEAAIELVGTMRDAH